MNNVNTSFYIFVSKLTKKTRWVGNKYGGDDHEVEFHEIEIAIFHEIKIAIFHEIEIMIMRSKVRLG